MYLNIFCFYSFSLLLFCFLFLFFFLVILFLTCFSLLFSFVLTIYFCFNNLLFCLFSFNFCFFCLSYLSRGEMKQILKKKLFLFLLEFDYSWLIFEFCWLRSLLFGLLSEFCIFNSVVSLIILLRGFLNLKNQWKNEIAIWICCI